MLKKIIKKKKNKISINVWCILYESKKKKQIKGHKLQKKKKYKNECDTQLMAHTSQNL